MADTVGVAREAHILARAYRQSLMTRFAVLFMVALALAAVFGPLLLGDAALRQDLDNRLLGPFHWDQGFLGVLGTDNLGRSILARLIVGTRTTLAVVLAAAAAATAVGFCVGIVSGYFGGLVDGIVMRVVDMMMTIPRLLLALSLLFLLDGGIGVLILVLCITNLPVIVRTARAQTLVVKESTFVDAARSMGAGRTDIMFRQLSPMVAPTVLTVGLLEVATIMLEVAGLSFLGVGLQPPAVSWGTMVSDGQAYLTTGWWLSAFPGVVITVTALSLLLVSNALRAEADPLQAARTRRSYKASMEQLRAGASIDG